MKVIVFARSSATHPVAGWTASRTCSRDWRGGEISAANAFLSCWYRYSYDVMSLCAVYNVDALKIRLHVVGMWPVKARLVMLQVSRESLGAFVLLLIVVGICCSNA